MLWTRIVLQFYLFINPNFFLVGVEQFKTSRTQVTFRERTRLIPFEWLQGMGTSVNLFGWITFGSFFWILGIGKHQSIPQTLTSTVRQITALLSLLTFKEYFNRQSDDYWLCPSHPLRASRKITTQHPTKNVMKFYVKTMKRILGMSEKKWVNNRKEKEKKSPSKS